MSPDSGRDDVNRRTRQAGSVPLLAAATVAALVAGAVSTVPAARDTERGPAVVHPPASPAQSLPERAQPPLSTEPTEIVDGLIDDERVLRDPSSSQAALAGAARRQQAAYRVLGRHPDWDALVRPRIPRSLLDVYDRNIDARRQLTALSSGPGRPTLPAWRIDAPAPADELLGYYREAEAASGVGWNYLAAINLVETAFGRISGVSTAGAQGPMQFLPSTFAIYGGGGDISADRDAIMAAGRFLAAHGFVHNRDQAIYRYNNSARYVRAVNQYAAVIGADPAAFAGYHRWDVYYKTSAGDVVLPVGYAATAPIPVEDYLADHPQ